MTTAKCIIVNISNESLLFGHTFIKYQAIYKVLFIHPYLYLEVFKDGIFHYIFYYINLKISFPKYKYYRMI